jgi:glycosyltransferase involved in cell wall biosynthesis
MACGGIETGLLNWVRTIDPARFEVHLFCFANPGGTEAAFVEAASRCGFPVARIPWNRRKPIIKAARLMAGYVRDRQIDILHCHNTYAQLVAAATGRLTGVRTITTFYLWGDFGWKRNALQYLDRVTSRLIDRLSVHCERTFADSVARGLPAGRLIRLPCGFDLSPVDLPDGERARRRGELGAAAEDVVLIYVARLWPEKAHGVALEGLRQILARISARPGTVRLWLVGSGPEEGPIRSLAADLRLAGNVQLLGYRTDVPELLALSDIQVHPSDLEGVSQAVCEGMAAGLPIVATDVGGLTEVLRDGESALLIPPRCPARMAEAVTRLIDDPELSRNLGQSARRFITSEYSLAASTARVETAYEEMLA